MARNGTTERMVACVDSGPLVKGTETETRPIMKYAKI